MLKKNLHSKKEYGRGGKRENAGRPRQFQEPTTFSFKCELSEKLAAKEKHGKALNQMFVEWLKSVLLLSDAQS